MSVKHHSVSFQSIHHMGHDPPLHFTLLHQVLYPLELFLQCLSLVMSFIFLALILVFLDLILQPLSLQIPNPLLFP